MSSNEIQPRAYGGKCGVWLKKKTTTKTIKKKRRIASELQHNSKDDDSLLLQYSSHETISCAPSSNSSENEDNDCSKESEQHVGTSARLVGWDDVLCRPIYQSAPESSDMSTDDAKADDIVINPDDSLAECKDAFDDDDDNPQHHQQQQLSSSVRKRAKRSYGNRQRSRMGLSDAAVEILQNSSSRSVVNVGKLLTRKATKEKDNNTSPKTLSSSSETHTTLLSTPPSSDNSLSLRGLKDGHWTSICSFPESSEEDDEIQDLKDSSNVLNEPEASSNENIIIQRKKSKRKSMKRKAYNNNALLDSSSLDPKNQTETQFRQPSSTSSLSSARAFFDNLDTTEQLSIDHVKNDDDIIPEASTARSRCVRTTRRANIDCPQLKQDYEEYCNATMLTGGVSPISLMEYANNRAHFQNVQRLDGFLDVALSSPRNHASSRS